MILIIVFKVSIKKLHKNDNKNAKYYDINRILKILLLNNNL